MNIFENKDSNQLGIKSVTNIFDEELSQEAKNILIKLNAKEETIDYKRLSFKRDKNLEFDFRDHKLLKEFFKDIYYKKFSTEEAEIIQEEFNVVLTALEKYKPRVYKNKKLKLLKNVKRFYDGRKMIINAFKNKIFPLYHERLERLIFLKRSDVNDKLVKKHFLVQDLEVLLKEIKDAEKNKIYVSLVRSGLRDLRRI